MLKLNDIAKILAAGATLDMTPRPVVNGVTKVMVMIATDIATMNETGRTVDMIEADARRVMYAVLDGFVLI